MVDMIEDEVPEVFVGGYVLKELGITIKQIENLSGFPESLITRVLQEGKETVQSPIREQLCKVLYEKSGMSGSAFWIRHEIDESVSDKTQQEDGLVQPPKEKLQTEPKIERKQSNLHRQNRILSKTHNKQNKKIGQQIKLTPAKVALIEHVRSEDDLKKIVRHYATRAAIINGDHPQIPKDREAYYEREIRKWFADTLNITSWDHDPFKLRSYKWNAETRRFDARVRTKKGFVELTQQSIVAMETGKQPKDIEQHSISTPIVNEKPGILDRIFKWGRKKPSPDLTVKTLSPDVTVKTPPPDVTILPSKKEVKKIEVSTKYSLAYHLDGKLHSVKTQFKGLREEIMRLDHENVQEKINKKTIVYKTAQNFCEIVVQTTGLLIFVDITKEEGLDDPRAVTEDVTTKGSWATGKTRIHLWPKDNIDYTLSIIKQAYKLALAKNPPLSRDLSRAAEYQAVINDQKLSNTTVLHSKKETKKTKTEHIKDIYSYTVVSSFTFKGVKHEVKYWTDVLTSISEIMLDKHRDQFSRVLDLKGQRRGRFTKNPNELHLPERIDETDIFVEKALSARHIVELVREIIALFGYSQDDIEFDFRKGDFKKRERVSKNLKA
jgi:predicted transport protein